MVNSYWTLYVITVKAFVFFLASYHGQLFAEDVKPEFGNDVVQEVASTDMAVNMEGHFAFHPLPFCQDFISLQLAVPSLEL
jgi:hypothetical protein